MSIYGALRDAGLWDSLDTSQAPTSMTAEVVAVDGMDGEPLVGIAYACDHATEEETGQGDLRRTLDRAVDPDSFPSLFVHDAFASIRQVDLVGEVDGLVYFSTRPVPPSTGTLATARRYIELNEAYAQGRGKALSRYRAARMVDLKALAKNRGVKGPFRTKAVLMEALAAADQPDGFPFHSGWFASGEVLILRREKGAYGLVLDALVQAAREGCLMTGGSCGVSVFGAGLSFFDSRDLGPQARETIITTNDLHEQRMTALAPVAQAMKAKGHGYYFLGNPHVHTDGDGAGAVRYWLNGHTLRSGPGGQPFGWYTLEELAAEKYVTDLEARQKGKRARAS